MEESPMDTQSEIEARSLPITLKKIQKAASRIGEVFCLICLLGIVISTALSVFLRYVFFFPLNFSDTLSVLMLTWLTFVGTGLAVASGEHVFVDFLAKRFPAPIKRLLVVVSGGLISFFLIVISYYGYWFAWNMRDSSDPMVFGISLLIPYISVPVGATYTLLHVWLATGIALFGPPRSTARA